MRVSRSSTTRCDALRERSENAASRSVQSLFTSMASTAETRSLLLAAASAM